MKLARFSDGGEVRLGKVEGDHLVDLTSAIEGLPTSMRDLIADLDRWRSELNAASGPLVALTDIDLLAPVDNPQKYLAIGMNYQAHADEAAAAGHAVPTQQLWFNKQVSCITGPYSPVEIPRAAPDRVDYEAELAFVIGKRCRAVTREGAAEVIAGYMVANDVTARDWQFQSPTYTLGKSFDTHGPLGPWLTTADEIDDPMNLEMVLTLNGQERQRASTSDMIHDIYAQIAHISTVMTLEVGDIIATGTPSGVGIASDTFMKVGDVVRVEIEGLGAIENRFVAGV